MAATSLPDQHSMLNGTSVSSTVPPISPAREWARSGEPGSAFSGLGRGGRGRGRGSSSGRGGRGSRGGRGRGSGDSSNDTNIPPKIEVPPIRIVAPPAPRTPTRRKRSQQHNKPSNPVAAKLTVPDPKLGPPRKARSGPSSPKIPPKDIPPHLNISAGPETTTFDMRTDINALVERVRAVAMAENRPTTPGIHIDWAGDEDDTLPDLDDWGVATGGSVSLDTGDTMSPISVGGLTPLPEPNEPSHVPKEEHSIAPFPPKLVTTASEQSKVPLHPSLPPKPVQAVETLPAQSRPRPGALSIYAPIPIDPSTTIAKSFMKVEDPVVTVAVEHVLKLAPEEEAESVSMQHSASPQRDLVVEGKGLDASIHAPKLFPESFSAPSHISSPAAPRAFHPTHNRSRTLGRSPDTSPVTSFPPMVSRSGNVTPRGRFSPQMNHHIRTHSSPTVSVMNPRPHHASRPVITGDAMSKLAKTVCSASVSSPRPATIAPSEE